MPTNLTTTIDRLGEIMAQIAELSKLERELKDVMIAAGIGAHDGELFRVTVSQYERETLDLAAVREKLSPQFLRAHTNVTPVTTVRVVARKAA
jgi:hypothetical protein